MNTPATSANPFRCLLLATLFLVSCAAQADAANTDSIDQRNRLSPELISRGCQMEQVAPGVWRIRFGRPEELTPRHFQEQPPRLKAMAALPPCARLPIKAAAIGFRTSGRGTALELPLEAGEQLYGLGMNLKVFQLHGKKTVRVSDNQTTTLGDSHAPVPFYVSTRGYGVYVDTARYASFYFGNLNAVRDAPATATSGSEDKVADSVEELYRPRELGARLVGVDIPSARGVDVYVIAGPDMLRAVQRYNLFSGGGCLPPMWGLGVWYRASAQLGQEEVMSFLREFRQRHIPCDVFGLEPGWHTHAYSCSFVWSSRFPDPDRLLAETNEQGYKLNLWEHAFTHPTSPLYKPLLPWSGDYKVWGGLVPDFATPEGRRIFAGYHAATLVDKGVSGFKLDECDHQPLSDKPWSFPEQTAFPSGLDGEQMHLLIGPLYQRTIAAIYRARNQRTLGLVRASGALAAPLPFALYSDAYDHRDYVRAIATSGFGGVLWCPEVRDMTSLEELYRRLETDVFSAVTQVDCWYLKNPPWKQINRVLNNRGQFMADWEPAEAACRKLLQMRMRLLPYLYSAYADYRDTGKPPARALVLDYPQDKATWTIDDQYMLGPSLMVAPLFTGETTRSVYLPKGDWYDFWTGAKYAGGQRTEIEKPAEEIPVFVKGDTLLPLADPVECVRPDTQFALTVRVYGEKPRAFVLYEDDGTTFDFEKGAQNRIELNWNGQTGTASKTGDYSGPNRYKISNWTKIANGGPSAPKQPEAAGTQIWKDPAQPLEARVRDLVGRMSLAEKVSQMDCIAPAIPRLGVPAYNYRNECLHGRSSAGRTDFTTDFPQAIGMAATWDTPLIHQEADVIATEARAAHNDYVAKHQGNSGFRCGLTYYSPNINIVRDPRWGRGQETYGEDPFLTTQMALAFIRGLQGDDPKYVKIMACAKHFAVHSGPESKRHTIDVRPSPRDLYETYLPAFEASVRVARVGSVMGAYSSLDGVPDCANRFLLTDLLRKRWGFDGFVISDGGAIPNIWKTHKYTATREEGAVAAVKAGCNMCSGGGNNGYGLLRESVRKGLISRKEIDAAVSRALAARFRVGLFDPPSMVPWSNITLAQNDTPENRALALKVARESIVLLKNDGLLPLDRARIKRIAVVGPNAASVRMLLGNYSANPSKTVTILDGIKAVAGANVEVVFEKGCPLALDKDNSNRPSPETTAQAVAAAKSADVVIFVGGIDASLESEENNRPKVVYQGFDRGDRTRIELPEVQLDLLKALKATGKPVVLVNCSGSAMAMPWEAENLSAIVQAWYPGEEGGHAVGEILFGDVNPSGRLPVTFYRSTADLPPFDDYSMANRTYRYFSGKPLYAFGHGLSYTTFAYEKAGLDKSSYGPHDVIRLSFALTNSGTRPGDEVAQVYFRHVDSAVPQARLSLCAFERVHLKKSEGRAVTLEIPVERFRTWDTARNHYFVEPGKYELLVGGASDDVRLTVPATIVAAGESK